MELIARIIFGITNWNMILFVPSIFLVVVMFMLRKPVSAAIRNARREGRPVPLAGNIAHKGLLLGALLSLGFTLFLFVNLLRPHFLDAPLIYKLGQQTDAKVINKEGTSTIVNDEPVVRFNVMYKTNDGEIVETFFHSSDFNFYPAASSVKFPQIGETFRIAYLASFPDVFVILSEADSAYKTNNNCSEIKLELDKAVSRRDFAPDDPKYVKEVAEWAVKYVDAGCGPPEF